MTRNASRAAELRLDREEQLLLKNTPGEFDEAIKSYGQTDRIRAVRS